MDNNEAVKWNLDEIINEITWNANFNTNGYTNADETQCGEEQNSNEIVDSYTDSIDLSFFDGNFNVGPEDVLAAEQLLNLSDVSRMQNNQAVRVDVAAVVNEAAAAVIESGGQTDFDPEEEQKKLLNLLQISTPNVENDTLLNNAEQHIQCRNCSGRFTAETFETHICEYDEYHRLTELRSKPEPLLPDDPPAMRVLRENQIRIRRFLKEELKIDLPPLKNVRSSSSTNGFCNNNSSGFGNSLDTARSNADISTTTTTTTTTIDDEPGSSSKGDWKKTDKSALQHECSMCDRRFVHASGLLRHIEKHALDLIPISNGKQTVYQQSSDCLRVIIKCQLCGRIFFESRSAFSHVESHFTVPTDKLMEMDIYCDVPYEAYVEDATIFLQQEACMTFNYETDDADNYLKVFIVGNVLQCEFCDFCFTDASYLFLHASTHTTEQRFSCQSCQISLESSKDVNNHFQAECVFMRESFKLSAAPATQRYFVCNVCEMKFSTLDSLLEHRYAMSHFFPRLTPSLQKLQVPCEYCEFICDNSTDLKQHFEDEHLKKCRREKELSMEANQTSVRQRQYLCDVCGKSYTQSSHLWQHLRFHQGVKPFACPEPGCSRKFTIRPDLHDHIRKCHTGERPFHCHICGKRFLTGSVFYQHRLIHRGERRYECTECGKRFYRADALKNHKRIHTGEKPFDCEYCTKSFRQRGDCDKHIRARHAHLDEETRQMLKVQKITLKAAAASAAAAALKHISGSAAATQQSIS